MKKFLIVSLFLMGFGCVSTSSTAPPAAQSPVQGNEPYVANFHYTPCHENAPGSVDVTFTVANNHYKTSGGLHWFASSQFANFPRAIREDFTEILTAKGFIVRGPFESYDLIPFQDKKVIDLVLAPTVELTVALRDRKFTPVSIWIGGCDHIETGNVKVSGKIILEMKEITTQELMWAKTIPVRRVSGTMSQVRDSLHYKATTHDWLTPSLQCFGSQ